MDTTLAWACLIIAVVVWTFGIGFHIWGLTTFPTETQPILGMSLRDGAVPWGNALGLGMAVFFALATTIPFVVILIRNRA